MITFDKIIEAKKLMEERDAGAVEEVLITLGLYEKLRELQPGLPEVKEWELPKRIGLLIVCNTLSGIGEFCYKVDPELYRSRLRPYIKMSTP